MVEIKPKGGRKKKPVSKKQIKKIIEGGRKADIIHKKAEEIHKEESEEADKNLDKELKKLR